MANMGYCRFENTLSDLEDCKDNMEEALGGIEFASRADLIEMCKDIAGEYGNREFEDHTECDGVKCKGACN